VDRTHEDVSIDLNEAVGRGKNHGSRLAWADFMRNTAVFEEVRSFEPSVLLDVGCGSSHWLAKWIARNELDTEYRGIDADSERIASLIRDNEVQGGRRSTRGYTIDMSHEDLPANDGEASMVVCLEAMEHFCNGYDDVLQFVEEVARVLHAGGVFVLATPNRGDDEHVLQHPGCHSWEAEHFKLTGILEEKFVVFEWGTYRAKPLVSARYTEQSFLTRMPNGLRDTLALYESTRLMDSQPPGNVLYFASRV
jgi:2-polyprenyl-3-methyl-5-hydroxy-6-metoxy-1,4-benzoquinol methylase